MPRRPEAGKSSCGQLGSEAGIPDDCPVTVSSFRPRRRPPDVGELAAAVARIAPSAVLSHRSAAQLWGLWIPQFTGVEVTTPAGIRGSPYTTSVQRRDVVAHRRITPPADITELHGLPVTTLERTWLDLSALLGIHDLIAAGDAALRSGASADELAERVARAHRLRGIARARRAVPLLDGRSRSRPESRIRAAIRLAGLPAPRVNRAIYDEHGQWLGEPDLHYEEARLAIEYNGAGHASERKMRKDSVRTLDFQRAAWKVLVYTAPHAFERLDEVVSDVYAELLGRAPHLLVSARLAGRLLGPARATA